MLCGEKSEKWKIVESLSLSHGFPYHTLLIILFFVCYFATVFLSLSVVFAIPCWEEIASVGVL